MKGYLKKKSPKIGHEMQRRFFRLDGTMLSYFKDEKDHDPKGVIPISSLKDMTTNGMTIELDVGYRKYVLVAPEESALHAWKAAIQAARGAPVAQEALPAWAAADPFDEDDEDSLVRPTPARRGARGKAKGGAAAGGGEGANPFGCMVGTNSEYAKKYTGVDPNDDSASLEQIEGAIAHHEKGIEDSLQRTLRLADTTRGIGATTLQQMHEQGEQLDRIAKDEAKVKANLDTSDRILRTMGSWRGAFANMVSSPIAQSVLCEQALFCCR